jgi:hypothetical protein
VKIDGNRIWVTEDETIHVSGNFQSGNAVFRYKSNMEYEGRAYSLRKNGRYYPVGQDTSYGGLSLGYRDYYQDPHR